MVKAFFYLLLIPQLDYPSIGGRDLDQIMLSSPIGATVRDLALYLFDFLILSGVILILLSLTFAGIKWLLSQGNPGKLLSAKNQMLSALTGGFILLASWVILNTLDPYLVRIRELPNFSIQTPNKKPLEKGNKIILIIEPSSNSKLPLGIQTRKRIVLDENSFPIPDITKFKLGGRTYDLSGKPNSDAKILGIKFEIEAEKDTEKLDWNKGLVKNPPQFHYGVLCFEKKSYKGKLEIVFSFMPEKYKDPPGIWITNLRELKVKYGGLNSPCQSLGLIKVPLPHKLLSLPSYGDNLTFYENPFPQRYKVNIDPTTGKESFELIGECIELGDRADLNCRITTPNLLPIHRIGTPWWEWFLVQGCVNLSLPGGKFPTSLEVYPANIQLYLILLLDTAYPNPGAYFSSNYSLSANPFYYVFGITQINNFDQLPKEIRKRPKSCAIVPIDGIKIEKVF